MEVYNETRVDECGLQFTRRVVASMKRIREETSQEREGGYLGRGGKAPHRPAASGTTHANRFRY